MQSRGLFGKNKMGRIFEDKRGTIGEVIEKEKWNLIGWLSVCKEFSRGLLLILGRVHEGSWGS